MKQYGILDLHQTSWERFLPWIPDNYFNLAIVDPPYFPGPEKRLFYGKNESITKRVNYKPLESSWVVPGYDYFNELCRVSRNQIIWGCNYYEFGCELQGRIVWDKCNQASDFSDCELASTSLFDSVRQFRFMWNGMLQGKSIAEGHIMQGNKKLNEKRIHPTQKPVALYRWLLENYGKSECKVCRGGGQAMGKDDAIPCERCNDTGIYHAKILDTHLGSGSIAMACYYMGFDLTGSELDSDYYAVMMDRIEKETSQMELGL